MRLVPKIFIYTPYPCCDSVKYSFIKFGTEKKILYILRRIEMKRIAKQRKLFINPPDRDYKLRINFRTEIYAANGCISTSAFLDILVYNQFIYSYTDQVISCSYRSYSKYYQFIQVSLSKFSYFQLQTLAEFFVLYSVLMMTRNPKI